MATTAPWASASVFGRMMVMRPEPSSYRWTLPEARVAASERRRPASDSAARQGLVELLPLRRLFRRLEVAAAPAGPDGGAADDGQDVGGEGAGLALGPGKSQSPSF